MCFVINPYAKPPEKTQTVYKSVHLTPEGLALSKLYKKQWTTGTHQIRKRALTEIYKYKEPYTRLHSHEGIYVFNRLVDAKDANYGIHSVILKLTVKPEDWIASNWEQNISTYRKVTVPEDQPYIEWY